jgi:hypothetical protein
MLVAVINELVVAPMGIVRDAGLAARLKSWVVEASDEADGAF